MLKKIALMSFVALAPLSVLLAADAPPASQPAKVEPVDYHKLKDLLPDTLAGEKRTNAEGEKTSAGEVTFTHANAEYGDSSKENSPTYHLEIFDYSATPGMGEGMAAWQNLQIDKEGDSGFEKTVKIADQPGLESYHKEGKDGSIQVWIAKRFLVNLTANNVTGDQLKALADQLPVAKLAALK